MKKLTHSIWQELAFTLPIKNEDPSITGQRLTRTFILPALTASLHELRVDCFTILLTVITEDKKMQVGVVCHMKPLIDSLHNILSAFFSGKDEEFNSYIESSRKHVNTGEFHISQGRHIPHTIALRGGVFSLKKRNFTISVPGCKTSDVLVALSALANSCPLIIDQIDSPEFRDTLLIEYLDRAQLAEQFNTRDFECCDDDPESWFLSVNK